MRARFVWGVVSVQAVLIVVLAVCLWRIERAPPPEEAAPPPAESGAHWQLRSQHLLYGMPRPIDGRYDLERPGAGRVPGVSVLVREGFVVGHCDRCKIPLWVSMHWTRADCERTRALKAPERSFREDPELPDYARGSPDYGAAARRFDRGHMARHQDNLAWGEDNAAAGSLMSNVVPQNRHLNRGVWLRLEERHHAAVSGGIPEIWVISGAVLRDAEPDQWIGNETGVPQAIYKIVAWHDRRGEFCARGFIFPQDAADKETAHYLVSIAEIERATGLDFFPELDREVQRQVETARPRSLWDGE